MVISGYKLHIRIFKYSRGSTDPDNLKSHKENCIQGTLGDAMKNRIPEAFPPG